MFNKSYTLLHYKLHVQRYIPEITVLSKKIINKQKFKTQISIFLNEKEVCSRFFAIIYSHSLLFLTKILKPEKVGLSF